MTLLLWAPRPTSDQEAALWLSIVWVPVCEAAFHARSARKVVLTRRAKRRLNEGFWACLFCGCDQVPDYVWAAVLPPGRGYWGFPGYHRGKLEWHPKHLWLHRLLQKSRAVVTPDSFCHHLETLTGDSHMGSYENKPLVDQFINTMYEIVPKILNCIIRGKVDGTGDSWEEHPHCHRHFWNWCGRWFKVPLA